jgi:regulator of sigma E protease
MESVLQILLFTGLLILSLMILVFWHELGHFLPAKWFGMRVEKFYLFFDWPGKIFSVTKKDTEYGIGMLPLGGYVKIAGMIDESMDKDYIEKPIESWEFRAKPVWQKAIVMVGGVTMNVLLGIFIFTMIKYKYGEEKTPIKGLTYGIMVPDSSMAYPLGFRTGDKILTLMGEPVTYYEDLINPNNLLNEGLYFDVERDGKQIRMDVPGDFIEKVSPRLKAGDLLFYPNFESYITTDSLGKGFAAGLRTGDKIVSIDSQEVKLFSDIRQSLSGKKSQTVALEIEREGKIIPYSVALDTSGKLGVLWMDHFKKEKFTYSLFGAIVPGCKAAFSVLFDTIKGFRKMFKGDVSASKSVAGPVKIAKMLGTNFNREGWLGFWVMTAMLSMVLAFMNILPIPALDGGHLLFLLIEAVIGKEPSPKVRMIAQQAGMILLLGLMVLILFNDVFSSL